MIIATYTDLFSRISIEKIATASNFTINAVVDYFPVNFYSCNCNSHK